MKTIYEFLLKSKTAVSTQGIGYVDLGLKSGLLWARCNIGADEPTEYGDYFMWGSTEPDTDKSCGWKNCPFNDGKSQFNDEYFKSIKNKVCPNNILASEYDAATVILGDGWRLPTDDDYKELIHNAEHEWITNYQGSRTNGILFTSNMNGAELFIPASGFRDWSSFHNDGKGAHLWSSTICGTAAYYAYNICLSGSVSSLKCFCFMNGNNRSAGFCLRGVKK